LATPQDMTPNFLYRYRIVNDYSLEEIRRNQVYFCPFSDLNDLGEGGYSVGPADIDKVRAFIIGVALRDNLPEFAQILRAMPNSELRKIEQEKMAESEHLYFATRTEWAVVCFSDSFDNTMMWGHYAASGKGMVIEYDLRSTVIPDGSLQKVVYSELPGSVSLSDVLDPQQSGRFVDILAIKKKEWEHEREWRILLREPKVTKQIFPITRVITGPTCTDQDKTEVVNAIRQHGSARFAQSYIGGGTERKFLVHDLVGGN
jgi:hypothetical protein